VNDRDYNWRHPRVRVTPPAPTTFREGVVDFVGYLVGFAVLYLVWWI